MKTITYKIAKVMRAAILSLIIVVALAGVSKAENSGKENVEMNTNELTVQLKSWMIDNTNWSSFDNLQTEEISANKTGNNFCAENESQDLSSKMKTWISNSNLWSAETDNNDQELASQIKSWMTNNAFWNGAEEHFNAYNELANN